MNSNNQTSTTNLAQIAVLFQQGISLHSSGQLAKAWEVYGRVIQMQPRHFDALHMAGLVAAQAGNYPIALDLIGKAIAINPNSAAAFGNRGNVYLQLAQYQSAIENYEKALQIAPAQAESYSNLGNAYKGMKLWEKARASYDKAILLKPDFAGAYCNRGVIAMEVGELQASMEDFQKAIQLEPGFADAYVNIGIVLVKTRRYQAAVEMLNKGLQLNPNQIEGLFHLGVARASLSHHKEAIEAFDKVLQLNPEHFEANCNRATTCYDMRQYAEAAKGYEKAYQQKPDTPFLLGMLTRSKMFMCDWDGFDAMTADLTGKLQNASQVAHPLVVTGVLDSPQLQRQAAQIFTQSNHPENRKLGPANPAAKSGKIVVGYYSSDFRNHAVAYLMAELFELHDKSKFECIAFSLGGPASDEMGHRIAAAFDNFIDVSAMGDEEITKLSRELNVHIAVDLNGFTKGSRTNIFALRAAPVQVNYMGYTGTMGADYIDYIIGDDVLIPAESRAFFHEKVANVPDTFQVNDRKRAVSEKVFSRDAFGLPASGFVFCCFNGGYKINPAIFDRWMRILLRVEGSVLWLRQDNQWAVENLRREAEKRGVNANRLVFNKYMAQMDEFLASQRLADLFIDTLPYNAHTTASDALWVGLPVVTCVGSAFAGRVAASLLNAIGLPELIVDTLDGYESLIVSIARDPQRLASIKARLNRNRLTSPLFDSPLFARHIESLYTQMYERHRAGLAPDHLHA